MPRSPLALAALATVAIPGLDAFDVRRSAHPGPGIDAAVVIDAEGGRWVIRAPQDSTAGAALEAEVGLLEALVRHVDAGHLPFDVPRPAGFVPLPEGGQAVVHPQLSGRPLRLEHLGPGPGLAAALGRAIAALHELPVSTVEDAGLPVYDAEAYRQRRLAEVDEAAKTGKVPATLLRRWEHALEDVAMWRFQPTVVHGDLSAEHVLCSASEPVAVLGWAEAKVADPADDLAWLLVAAPQEAVDPIVEAYHQRRTELRDPHLAARALLAGELAVARWLLHGVRSADQAIIDDASAMLTELDEHIAAETAAQDELSADETAGAWGSGGWGREPEPVDAVQADGPADHVADDGVATEGEAAVAPDESPASWATHGAAPEHDGSVDVAEDPAGRSEPDEDDSEREVPRGREDEQDDDSPREDHPR